MMRKKYFAFFLAIAVICFASMPSWAASTRFVKDSEGGLVEIPAEVTKAAPLIGAFAQMTEMLTAGSGKISAAATNNISDYFKEVFPDYVKSNPNNYNSSAIEDLIASGSQVVYGPDSFFSDDQKRQLASANIAYVAINHIQNVDGMCESFGIIGSILGPEEEKRAADFVDYYRGNIDLAKRRTGGVGDKLRFLSVFYSADTYNTINGSDICNEYIEAAGGVNVAKDYMPRTGGNSLIVDSEQIVAWNPQFIMTSNQSGRIRVLTDPALAQVDAVKNRRVHVTPYGVYLWSVRSGEGSMLPLWLGKAMYPDLFRDVDMPSVVKNFFNKYYNYNIAPEEIAKVLEGDANTGMTR
jgi:iron complex transport system substrate-binding protein